MSVTSVIADVVQIGAVFALLVWTQYYMDLSEEVHISNNISTLQQTVSNLREDLKKNQDDNSALEKEVNLMKVKNTASQLELSNLTTLTKTLQDDNSALENELKSMKEKDSTLQHKLSDLTTLTNTLKDDNLALKKDVKDHEKELKTAKETTGITYVRHGHHSCPGTAKLLYNGYSGGAHYSHHGGGSNYLCLPKQPEWPAGAAGGHQSQSFIYGVEYQYQNSPLMPRDKHDNDVPCAVCEASGRTQKIMLPAKLNCHTGWTKEFTGFLMAHHHTHQMSADFTCVDSDMQTIDGGHENKDGGLFYIVEAACGSLPCPPYHDGYEIACVVCTK